MKRLSVLALLIFTALFFVQNIEAKVLPQSQKSPTKQTSVRPNGTTIGVSPKLRADRRALLVNFSNLQNAKSVSYMLTYKSGNQEGAGGQLNLTGASTQTVELLFGTCSKNVCRYHPNIKDARLEVSYTSSTGKKYLKKFKIRLP